MTHKVAYTGRMIYPDLNDLKSLEFGFIDYEDFLIEKLSDRNLIGLHETWPVKVFFDFDGGESYWPGSVRGFLYEDGKFVGNAEYVKESHIGRQTLNGRYLLTDTKLEVKGSWYDHINVQTGFYFQLDMIRETSPTPIVKEMTDKRTSSNSFATLLSLEMSEKITKRSKGIRNKQKNKTYFYYTDIVTMGLVPKSKKEFIQAASMAYAWMPTMLDLHAKDNTGFEAELAAVTKLGEIKTLADFERNESEINEALTLLMSVINHSIVGTSKALHIFYPGSIPIIDKNVLKAWNKLFQKHYSKHPGMQLPSAVSGPTARQVKSYMKYWKLILHWSENSGILDLRVFEEPLYWIGKS